MNTLQEYEEVTKGLMETVRMAKEASLTVQSLENKLRFVRLQNELSKALSIVRKQYYEVEAAIEVNVTHCGECGSVI